MVGQFRRALRQPISSRRRIVPAIVALGAAGALVAPGVAAAASPTVVVSGDSVLVTSLPSFGQATVTVTRPDAITGQPVVIGTFSGVGNSFTPLSVNTITPTPLAPSGDCWQKGALPQALTPDIQPGDTVSVSQAGFLGTGGTSSSVVVRSADEANATPGPIAGCSSLAPWARNAITSAPSTLGSGKDLTVSGVAQPLASGVSISASAGGQTTASVSVAPASDGTWTATIPADELAKLGRSLTVTPIVAVPDASTGAPAHIAGVGANVTVNAPSQGNTGQGNAGQSNAGPGNTGQGNTGGAAKPKAPQGPAVKPPSRRRGSVKARVASVRGASQVSLAKARKHGVQVSFVVPRGVHALQIRLRQNGKIRYTALVSSHRVGSRQIFTLPGSLFKRLSAGRYTIYIKAASGRKALAQAPAASHTLRLTR